MRAALADAGRAADDVALVVAAAGGYEGVDAEEARALRNVFGPEGAPVVAPKSRLGETLGAAGPINLAVALAALERQALPASPAGPADGLDLVIEARESGVPFALVNAAHPDGGAWVSLVVSRRCP